MLLISASCSSATSREPRVPEAEAPQVRPPANVPPPTPEAARKTPPQESWVKLEDKPVIDLAERATDEAIGGWISELGGKDDGEARRNLARQGVRIADRLREAAKSQTPGGKVAAELLAVLEPRFVPAYTAEDLRSFVVTADGKRCLVWKWSWAWNLTLFDAMSGTVAWTRLGSGNPQHPLADPCWHLLPRKPCPASKDGSYLVATQDRQNVEVSLADGEMVLVAPPQPRTDDSGMPVAPSWGARIAVLPDRTRVAWEASGVLVTSPLLREGEWRRLTQGAHSWHVQEVCWTPSHFLALFDHALAVYDRGHFKLLYDPSVPEGSKWMSVSDASGTITLGGQDWPSFAVLRGLPPIPVGRVATQVEGMVAMAADPGGRWIATADENNLIRIFLAETLERLAQFDGGMKIGELRFVGDGSVLLAFSPDNGWSQDLRAFRLAGPEPAK